MRRPAAVIAAASVALAFAGCGSKAIRDNSDKKPTPAVKALLAAGPAADCTREAPRDKQLAFLKAHPELTNKQLAKICPGLYPSDYLTKNKKTTTATTPTTTTN
jgi:hypothetical protein